MARNKSVGNPKKIKIEHRLALGGAAPEPPLLGGEPITKYAGGEELNKLRNAFSVGGPNNTSVPKSVKIGHRLALGGAAPEPPLLGGEPMMQHATLCLCRTQLNEGNRDGPGGGG